MKQILLAIAIIGFTSCGVRSIPMTKNETEAKWAEVENQYKRRNDLIPNLVNTVKGYAKHEKDTLEAVISARASATQIKVDPSNLTPAKLKSFQQAQGQLSQALGRLMMVAERYPELKASENFQALQAQLEGTENRITIARRRFIESVKNFNNLVTVFPTNITNSIFFQHKKMPQFEAAPAEKIVPKVKF